MVVVAARRRDGAAAKIVGAYGAGQRMLIDVECESTPPGNTRRSVASISFSAFGSRSAIAVCGAGDGRFGRVDIRRRRHGAVADDSRIRSTSPP